MHALDQLLHNLNIRILNISNGIYGILNLPVIEKKDVIIQMF